MQRVVIGFLAFVLVAPAALAGSAQAPEVKDDANDAGPNGTVAPVGFGWGDIVAAWFEGESDLAFTLKIQVSDGMVPPENAVIGVQFVSGKGTFAAGFGRFFGQGSGFVCGIDGQGNPQNCSQTPPSAEFANSIYSVKEIPREFFSAQKLGDRLDKPEGFAGQIVFDPTGVTPLGQYVLVDSTPVGKAYVFAKGKPSSMPGDEPVQALNSSVSNATTGLSSSQPLEKSSTAQPEVQPKTPGFQAIAGIAAIAAVAFGARRRLSP